MISQSIRKCLRIQEAGERLDESYYRQPSFIKSRTKAVLEPFGFKHTKTRGEGGGGVKSLITHEFEHPDGRAVVAAVAKVDTGSREVHGKRWDLYDKSPSRTTYHPPDQQGFVSAAMGLPHEDSHDRTKPVKSFDRLDDLADYLRPKAIADSPGNVSLVTQTPRFSTTNILQSLGFRQTDDPSRFFPEWTHPDLPGHRVVAGREGDKYCSVSHYFPSKSPSWKGRTMSRLYRNKEAHEKLKGFLDKEKA